MEKPNPLFKSSKTNGEWQTIGSDPDDAPNSPRNLFATFVSDVLSSQDLLVLAGLGTSLAVPGAPRMADLWAAVAKKREKDLKTVAAEVGYTKPEGGDNIELLLSRCQLALQFKANTQVGTFVSDAETTIVEKCRGFLRAGSPLETHQAFLRRVARRSTRLPRTKLFTTNYDLCFETAASQARFVVIDGFSPSTPQTFDGSYFCYDMVLREQEKEVPEYIDKVFHLYKLHGSVNWARDDAEIVKEADSKKPLIIYPRGSKYENSYEQPYLEMMSRLQLALRTPHIGLLVIGFGFNDAHIAQPIMAALRSNVSLKALVVGPDLKDSSNSFIKGINAILDARDPRAAMLNGTFEWLVPNLPDLIPSTEDEAHRERVRPLKAL
jgi:hypothetical protein